MPIAKMTNSIPNYAKPTKASLARAANTSPVPVPSRDATRGRTAAPRRHKAAADRQAGTLRASPHAAEAAAG